MKRISQKEFGELKFSHHKGNNLIIVELRKLHVGDILSFSKAEWTLKTLPSGLINQTFRGDRTNKKFLVRTLTDNSGWVAKRIT